MPQSHIKETEVSFFLSKHQISEKLQLKMAICLYNVLPYLILHLFCVLNLSNTCDMQVEKLFPFVDQ